MRAPAEIYAAIVRRARRAGPLDARVRALLDALADELELPPEVARRAEEDDEAERRASRALPGGAVDLTALAPGEPISLDVGQALSAVALSPDAAWVAAASLDHRVYLFDLAGAAPARVLEGHRQDVNGVAWLDGGALLSVADDGEVIRWDPLAGAVAWRARPHAAEATAVATSPSGDRVATGGWDRRVALLDPATGAILRTLAARDRVNAVAWSPDGARVAGGVLGGVHLWDADSGAERQWLALGDGEVLSLAVTPAGALLAAGDDRGVVTLVDLEQGAVARTLGGHREPVTAVAFGAGGRMLVTGAEDDTVRLWEVDSGRALARLDGRSGAVRGVDASADGRVVVAGGDGGDGEWGGREAVRVWRL